MRTLEEITKAMARATMAPSCVHMGWLWEAKVIYEDLSSGVGDLPCAGFLIRTTFDRPDRDTGVRSLGVGAWHHLPADVSDDGIAKRMFVAAKAILEHELMEAFRVDDTRVFDPHHSIADLKAAAFHAKIR